MSQDRNTTLSEIPDKGALGQSTLGPSRPWDQGAPWGAEKGDNLVAAAVHWGEISVSQRRAAEGSAWMERARRDGRPRERARGGSRSERLEYKGGYNEFQHSIQ